MRRWFKITLQVLPWGLALLFAYLWLSAAIGDWATVSTLRHAVAARGFQADLAYEACTTRDDVIAMAAAHDFPWRPMQDFHWCYSPTDLTGWLRVEISPPLPFSTEDENTLFFGFDSQGCAARWSYTSCDPQ